ncbi:chloride channel protein [Desulfonema magnum]|uniref:Chloride channel family protein n=1 Tax=Desulfonema magnum TaxID=45655 RepID=A0A975BSX8_9BACT|nr:chloride channel protein [Desulfonema magnum]QTA91204.1 Chloride channel family protein [Desulfonema magnum]
MRILNPLRYIANWIMFRPDDRLLLMFIGIIVGICSGLAALALNKSLVAMLEWLHPYRHLWWAFVLPAAGAALSSLFLNKIVKEGAGHGVPEVIYSVSRYGGLLRFRSSFSRLISSCLTIGSGGSAGPEAPVVMSGASIGSNIAKFFSLNDRQRITIVGCGAAGAISSIFNAPIAGLVFTMEVILGEWTALNIVPIAMASVAGTEVSRILQGNQIPFSHRQFSIDLVDILACFGLAVSTALASILLTRLLRSMRKISGKVPFPLWLRAAVGGCAVGGIGIFLPVVLGEGYHSIRTMIEGGFSQGLLIAAIGTLAKILATALTLGWGGSGGIFAPSLVIGSLVGLTYHRFIVLLWPSVSWVNEGCFALLGMAGIISGMLQAPLTGIFLIVEITGGYDVILPLIIVSATSSTLCHYIEPASFYLKELVDKGQLLRPGTDARVLSDLSVLELLEKDCITVTPNMLLREFIEVVKKSHRNYFPVEDEKTGDFLGMIHLDDIRPYLFNPVMYDAVFLEQIMNPRVQIVRPDDDLSEILHRMNKNRLFSMPVIGNNKFLGMISKATLLDQYRKELRVQTTN